MKKKKTVEELLGREYLESHERTNRMLAERLAYHQRKLAEERAASARPADSQH
jgi:hypothetical protein